MLGVCTWLVSVFGGLSVVPLRCDAGGAASGDMEEDEEVIPSCTSGLLSWWVKGGGPEAEAGLVEGVWPGYTHSTKCLEQPPQLGRDSSH